MPEVATVRVSPTWAVPLMAGFPVAGLLGAAATAPVAAPVRVSEYPPLSVKATRTLMVRPTSADTRV